VLLPALHRATAVPFLAAALAFGAAAGCGGEGSNTRCDLAGCTVTFQRDGTASVSVLGVSATLVGVDEGSATIEVAGQTVTVPAGGQTQAEGFTVGVESVTDTEVVIRVSR
jgi:hypothetical protein